MLTGMVRRFSLAALAGVLLTVAVAAHAVEPAPAGTVRAVPNRASAGAKLVLHADGVTAGLRSDQPAKQVTLAFQRGFRLDGAAVAGRCTDARAKHDACPARSRIARGAVAYRIGGPLPPGAPARGTADLGGFLGTATGSVQFVVHDRGTGMSFAARGRLVRVPRGPFGTELRFAVPSIPLPAGFTLTIDRLELTAGAQRRVPVARRAARSRTQVRHLITNPPRCPRSRKWTVELRATYGAGTDVRRAAVVCRP